MVRLKKAEIGRYTVYSQSELTNLSGLIDEFQKTPCLSDKGRGGIKILHIENRKIACRQYIHGGIFRFFTGDAFFSAKRSINEIELLIYLEKAGIPAVKPFCIIEERRFLFKKLHILTIFEENTKNLTDYLVSAQDRQRLRLAKKIAYLFWMLEQSGVYHPDLHLDNMLFRDKIKCPGNGSQPTFNQGGTGVSGDIILIDFDRARRKRLSKKDVEDMFWRLNRYIEKMEKKGGLRIGSKEKTLFLRTYERLSGSEITESMKASLKYKQLASRIGWKIESFFYRT